MGTNNLKLVLGLSLCLFSLALGSDTISVNQSLSGDQTIISSGGRFELGFHQFGKSSNYYLCMWYSKLSTKTIAWVANRETPVNDRYTSSVRILDGNLLILNNNSQTPIWSTNHTLKTSNSVVAVLKDDGNLVLLDGPGSSPPIWQSYDYPAQTWFPGGKLSYNKKTKTHQKLVSWKNSDDPSPGLFSFGLDADNDQYLISWNGTEKYWTSGPWNGKIFSLVPEMRLNYIFNFSYIDNENESYFTYSLYNDSITSRFIMDISGQVKQLTWLHEWNLFWSQPRQQCEVYAFCGAFGYCNGLSQPFCNCLKGFGPKSDNEWKLSDYSGGCKRIIQLQCESSSLVNQGKDKFMAYPNIKLPVNHQTLSVNSSSDCESSCLNNCSCTAYAFKNYVCSIWIGDLINIEQLSRDDGSGTKLYLKLAASEFSKSKSSTWLIIGGAVGSVVVVGLLCALFVFFWRRRSLAKTKTIEGSLVDFAYGDLQIATKNFSEKLGGGGFGSVYKGTLPDSDVITVKKLDNISQSEKQFRMEVSTFVTIQHVNLVRLRGFCSEGSKKLLVYDYMPNGSLDAHIFKDKGSKVLDWKTRYQIALGTARGLFYLHEKCRDCIIHCDIKPENILLDNEFCSKVADFGLAKLMGRDFSRVLTTMRGTRGYLAPEWISGVAVTDKADVYSFGMMLFEVVTGRRNSDPSEDGKTKYFPSVAARVVIEGHDILSLLDPRLERYAEVDEVTRICRIACWCIQDDENHRPSMGQVVLVLQGVLDVNPPPLPRSLQVVVDDHQNIVFFTGSSSSRTSHTHSNPSITSSQSKSTISSMITSPPP